MLQLLFEPTKLLDLGQNGTEIDLGPLLLIKNLTELKCLLLETLFALRSMLDIVL